jgi:hypothetical protein
VKPDTLSVSDFRQTETCSDCIERGDVDLLGRIRKGRAGRVRSCMGCNGTARVPRAKLDAVAWWVANRGSS